MLKKFLIFWFSVFLFLFIFLSIAENFLNREFILKIINNITYSQMSNYIDEIKKQENLENYTNDEILNLFCSYFNEIPLNISENLTIKINCKEFNNFKEFVSIFSEKFYNETIENKKCEKIIECIKNKQFQFLFHLNFERYKTYLLFLTILSLAIFVVVSRNLKEIFRSIGLSLLINSLPVVILLYLPYESYLSNFQLLSLIPDWVITSIEERTLFYFKPLLIIGIVLFALSFIFREKKS